MKVQLLNYVGYGSGMPARIAAELLVFTKNTRLKMDADQHARIASMSDAEIHDELAYMAKTIPSSWEFLDYTMLITEVTRAFTHQLVRTRQGSYAQQTMRVLDVGGFTYETGPSILGVPAELAFQETVQEIYDGTMRVIRKDYDELIARGVAIEDARGILPTNIHTNIVAKFNLRTLCELVTKRSSSRTQGEYRSVLDAMKAEVVRVHPFAQMFLDRDVTTAAGDLEQMILTHVEPGKVRTDMIKLIDELRKQ